MSHTLHQKHTHPLWPLNRRTLPHTPVLPAALTDLQVDVLKSEHLELADGEEREPDADTVPQSSHDGVPQHCADVLEERPGGHEVAVVEDDGREHVEEEDVWAEDGGGLLFDWVHDGADDEADANEEAGLWDPDGDFMVNVETWREKKTMKRLDAGVLSCTAATNFRLFYKNFILA